ncbi:MAG: hypothetical protein HFJ20_07560 [Clostridia bacterium]|nr:hypothetical protein [Clostridia bacterium]
MEVREGKCVKIVELFKQLLDEIHSLNKAEYETLLAGIELADYFDRVERINKLRKG